jgi:hypothetical protein
VSGERDLRVLLAELTPRLSNERYSFASIVSGELDATTFALIVEDEGTTRIAKTETGEWARISIGVHSSLEAVGLTAALAQKLADCGISANVVAAMRHDHLFVPWERRSHALRALQQLQEGSKTS